VLRLSDYTPTKVASAGVVCELAAA
jgi:hypothetical protein